MIQSLIRSFIKNIKRLLRLCIQIPFMFYIIFILRKTSMRSVSRTNLLPSVLKCRRICQHITCSTNEWRWSSYFNSLKNFFCAQKCITPSYIYMQVKLYEQSWYFVKKASDLLHIVKKNTRFDPQFLGLPAWTVYDILRIFKI